MPAQDWNRWQRDDYEAAQRREAESAQYSKIPQKTYTEEPSPVRWLILAALIFGLLCGLYGKYHQDKGT
jgi:hypothetical protein